MCSLVEKPLCMLAVLLIIPFSVFAQTDPATRAYEALANKNYDRAIAGFDEALRLEPQRSDLLKDFGYTLLKTGQTEAARDRFRQALAIDPADEHVALEYAFLCYETREPVEARRVFDRLRREGRDPETRASAAQAFENIDRPLREGIARWTEALSLSPDNFSGHEELARLAEQRDELALAAEHYEKAWRLRPGRRGLLLDLGRVWKQLDRLEQSNAALLAASRGADPRTAEQALDRLPSRYPFPYEFEKAVELDPASLELRREVAYLRLEMGEADLAERAFAKIVEAAPSDLLSAAQLGFLKLNRGDQSGALLLDRVLESAERDPNADPELIARVRSAVHLPAALKNRSDPPPAPVDAKLLGERSLEKGYLADAFKYLHLAHENDPVDFDVMLKLGRAYNIAKDDREAVRWFDLARRSPDRAIASEASRAYRNLAPTFARFRTTLWAFPTFSTRWHDAFTYAQIKTEWLASARVRPYLSVRFIGDLKGAVELGAGLGSQALSERSVILGAGVASRAWKGLSAWFELGESFPYFAAAVPQAIAPDYRGGFTFARRWGASKGWFAESNDDGVFVSRFGNDSLGYSQNRTGYSIGAAQFYWNWNVTGDLQGQPWANFAETGPGVRFRMFSVSAVHGVYLVSQQGVRRPNYNDVRVGLWYALTR